MVQDSSSHVIQYLADITRIQNAARRIESINENIANNIGKEFANVTRVVGQNLDSLSQKKIDIKGKDAIQTIQQTGFVVETADGKFKQFTETLKSTDGNIPKVTSSLKDVSGTFTKTAVETEKASKSTVSLKNNLIRLAKRAALTIPVWFALRGAITGVFTGIRNGLRDIIAFDESLQKLRKNLQGTTEEVDRNFKKAQQTITEFAIKSGKSTEEVTRAIQRFATVGFDFETSLKGGLDATKLAVTLFGEAGETANAFARALNVLVNRSDKARSVGEQISEAFALTSELWEVNAFEIGELSQGLEKFAGTAKSLNLTTEETITLLAALSTQGLNATRGGTLLRTSFQKLEENLDKTAKTLGVRVNPEVDRTFDVFRRVTNAIAELNSEAGTVSPQVTEAIRELFGGVRGGEPVRDIIADIDKVNTALDKFADSRSDVVAFNKEFEDISETLFVQARRFDNLKKEIGKAFVTGLTGADNFAGALKNINGILQGIQKNAEVAGSIFRQFFSGQFDFAKVGPSDFFKFGAQLAGAKSVFEITEDQLRVQREITKLKKAEVALNNQNKKSIVFEKDRQEIAKAVLESEIKALEAQGASQAQILGFTGERSKQLRIEEDKLDVIKRQLTLEQQINEERRLQSKLGSDSVKLFKIAQEQGTQTAKAIAEVLSGDRDFATFVRRGGQELEIFKKEFAEIFEQQQAQAFFRGDTIPGLAGLRGGTDIPIAEEALRDRQPSLARTRIEASRIRQQATPVRQPVVINNTFNVAASTPKEAADEILRKFEREIQNFNSPTGKALRQAQEDF